jgi:8-oxo-dGTP pyrophosphatase MutT (NUDIX family)
LLYWNPPGQDKFCGKTKLVLFKAYNGSKFNLTAGGVETGETTIDTAIRETYEESCRLLTLQASDLELPISFNMNGRNQTIYPHRLSVLPREYIYYLNLHGELSLVGTELEKLQFLETVEIKVIQVDNILNKVNHVVNKVVDLFTKRTNTLNTIHNATHSVESKARRNAKSKARRNAKSKAKRLAKQNAVHNTPITI